MNFDNTFLNYFNIKIENISNEKNYKSIKKDEFLCKSQKIYIKKRIIFGKTYLHKLAKTKNKDLIITFSEKRGFKNYLHYMSRNHIFKINTADNLHFIENARLVFSIFSTQPSQFFFHHLSENFAKYLNDYDEDKNQSNSIIWFIEYKKSLHFYIRNEKRKNRNKKYTVKDYTKNLERSICRFFFSRKTYFFKKLKVWVFRLSRFINSVICKISSHNANFFVAKLIEVCNYCRLENLVYLHLLEKIKYDFSRLFLYGTLLVSFFKCKSKNTIRDLIYRRRNISEYQLDEIVKITDQENVLWLETHIDLVGRNFKNIRNKFFLISKRKKEFIHAISFLLLFEIEKKEKIIATWCFFQNYISILFGNRNYTNSWIFDLSVEFCRKIRRGKKKNH